VEASGGDERAQAAFGGGRDAGSAKARAGFHLGRVFQVAAYALLLTAAVLLYLRRPEAAFLAAGFGAALWFLNVRATLIRKHDLVKVGGRNYRPRSEVEADAGEDSGEDAVE